jgi:hypothetical protein
MSCVSPVSVLPRWSVDCVDYWLPARKIRDSSLELPHRYLGTVAVCAHCPIRRRLSCMCCPPSYISQQSVSSLHGPFFSADMILRAANDDDSVEPLPRHCPPTRCA